MHQCIFFVFRNLPNQQILESNWSELDKRSAQCRSGEGNGLKQVANGRKRPNKELNFTCFSSKLYEANCKVGLKSLRLSDSPHKQMHWCACVPGENVSSRFANLYHLCTKHNNGDIVLHVRVPCPYDLTRLHLLGIAFLSPPTRHKLAVSILLLLG